MENNKLDQFFRDKLNQGNPASFNPAHWEEAKKMLTKNRKSKKGFYWILVALFMLLSWSIFSVIGPANKKEQDQTTPMVKKWELAETSDRDQVDNPILEETPVLSQTALQNQKKSSTTSGKLGFETSTKVPNKIGDDQVIESLIAFDKLDQKAGQNANSISIPERNDMTIEYPSDLELNGHNGIQLNDSVEKLVVSSPALNFNYDLKRPSEDGSVFRNDRIKRIRMGWSGTLLVNPGVSNSPVQGMTIGLAYERFFSRHWMYGMRPSLQLRGNEGGFSKFEQITTFGFSSVNTTYGLKANSLQFVSAPLYVAGEFGRHQVEAGFSVDLLLGARGQLQEVSVEDQVVSNLQNINSGWIDTGDMKRISSNLFVGYKNAINNRLKTGITFFYNPAKFYPGLPNNQSQIVNAKWYLGWQVTYYVK